MSAAIEPLKAQLSILNAEELDQIIEFCRSRKESVKREAADRIVAEIREKLRESGLDAEFLLEKLGGRSAVKRKRASGEKQAQPYVYINPDNHEEGWTGRGRKPAWLKEKVDAGASIESFRV